MMPFEDIHYTFNKTFMRAYLMLLQVRIKSPNQNCIFPFKVID